MIPDDNGASSSVPVAALDLSLPCNTPCPKCGGADIFRKFREKGTSYRPSDLEGDTKNKYSRSVYPSMQVTKDHIDNTCRTCGYKFQLLPLKKTT